MTVLQIRPSDEAAHSRPGPFFPGSGRQIPHCSYRQVQDWTEKFSTGTGRQRPVITERCGRPGRNSLHRDLPMIILVTALALFLAILLSDISTVSAVSAETRQLTSTIASLENSNSLLRSELSIALSHPVLLRKSEGTEEDADLFIIQSAIPES